MEVVDKDLMLNENGQKRFRLYEAMSHRNLKPVCGNDTSILIDAEFEVLILAAEAGLYGVIPVELNGAFEKIQRSLLKLQKKDKLPTVENPLVNTVYAEWANIIARVEVVQTDPLILYYLDFAYEEIKDSYCDLRMIPSSLAHLDPVAFKITVKNCEVELHEGQTIIIKILEKIWDAHYFVEVLSKTDHSSTPKTQYETESKNTTTFREIINNPTPSNKADTLQIIKEIESKNLAMPFEEEGCSDDLSLETDSTSDTFIAEEFITRYPTLPNKSFLDEISVHSPFMLTVMNCLTDTVCTGMLMKKLSPHRRILRDYLSNLTAAPDYKPEVGDLISAVLPDSEIWTRGVVLSQPTSLQKKYRVAMIDVGCAYDVDEIAPLDNSFHDLSNLSVYCVVNKFPAIQKPLKLYKAYKGEISEKFEDGTIVGRLWKSKKPDQQYEVTFKPWTPSIDELGVSKIPIQNNSRVKITAYNTSNTCHISLCDDESIDDIFSIMEEVADFCLEGPPMMEEPFLLEIVGVEYEDTFWRGRVLEKQADSYLISLLDRGIECVSNLEHMRPLPEHLKLPCGCAVPVTLKKVPVTDVPNKVRDYMKSLIEEASSFDVLIDEDTGEVELKFVASKSYNRGNDQLKTLNEYLAELLAPNWEKHLTNLTLGFGDAFSDTKFFNDHLKYDELVVGSRVTLYMAAVSKTDASLIAVNKNGKNYKKLLDINLFERLADYANTLTDPYVPSVGELCIVKNEDVWYRAICLDSQPNSQLEVQLIDDGRIVPVWHTDTRKMIPEFCHYVATALLCTIKDEQQFDRAKAEKLVNSEMRVNIVERKEHDEYVIDCAKYFD